MYPSNNNRHLRIMMSLPDTTTDPPQGGTNGGATTTKTMFAKIDEVGLSLKPKAVKASANMGLAESTSGKVLYLLQTCALYALFILYRAYRGFFVILPAVFKEVAAKMETAIEFPFSDEDEDEDDTTTTTTAVVTKPDVNPETGRLRWRTRITVWVLASFVTATYVAAGAVRVASKFVRNLVGTKGDVPASFAAAAMEQEHNEDQILRRVAHKKTKSADSVNKSADNIINGATADDDDAASAEQNTDDEDDQDEDSDDLKP